MNNQELFDKYLHGKHWEQHPTIYAEGFVDFLRKSNVGNVIDVGCGNGRDVAVFGNAGFPVIGVDYSTDVLYNARALHPTLPFVQARAEQLPFANGSIGAGYMINAIHYLNQPRAIEEIKRVLVVGGYWFVHFNVSITDESGNVDYQHDVGDIRRNVSPFRVVEERRFERVDTIPHVHTHDILELILQSY